MQLVVKVLEDKSTLFQLEKLAPDSLRAPMVQLVSIFAVQPSRDILDEDIIISDNQLIEQVVV